MPPARLRDQGLNPLAWRLLLIQAAIFIPTIAIFAAEGMSLVWSPAATVVWSAIALVLGLWAYLVLTPGTEGDRRAAEALFVVFLVLVFTNIGSPAQYAGVALRRPLADPWLHAADAWMGVHVPTLAAWTRDHPWFSEFMKLSYATFLPQIVLAIVGLLFLRERERLWEFLFHFHVCLTIALVAFAVWPAACTNVFYGFSPTIDQDLVIKQIREVRAGTLRTLRVEELQGLISFPSVHAAGGLIVTWAFRGYKAIQVPLILVNVAMLLSTFVTGVHYAIDTVAAFPLFALSLVVYRAWGRGLIAADTLRVADQKPSTSL